MPNHEPIPHATATPRVLLIEDDVDLAESLQAGLRPDGIDIVIAKNGPEAIESVRTRGFDVILLDLGLPGADGFDLLREFKQIESLVNVPVIVVTAKNSTADKVRGFELGAVDYVTKPFELVELRARVRSTLRMQRLQADLLSANKDLQTARITADESAQAKADFLANMSHEIRTPMNGVIAMTGLLMQTDLTADQRDFVETIRTSGESLLTIISDILNFSKLESGKMELEDRPFDLRACVEESLDLLAAKASEKNLDLAYQFAAQVPEQVIGDVTRVRQVLVNLIGNAVKFTSSGEIFIRVTSRPLPTAESSSLGPGDDISIAPKRFELQFSVRDTGIGIPPDRLGRLFQSFTQADSSIERHYGGTGLGLAISKGLVELMRGRMWVESELHRGSTFKFTLPVPAPHAATVASLHQPHKNLEGRRVLVVEENAAIRQLIVETVSAWGMTAASADSVSHALAQVVKDPPDVVIVDLKQPAGLDGPAFINELGRLPNLQALPVIALTPVGARPELPTGSSSRWISLSKPIKPEQLQAGLLQLQSGSKPAIRKAQPVSKLDSSMAARLPLRILLTDDNVINQKVALRLLQQLGYKADTANNGLEAIRALERQPYDVIFMDVQMPELDGMEATRRIRERQQVAAPHPHFQRPVVIIAMTANAMHGDREKCMAAGMNDYLPKPVRPEGLQAVLELHGPRPENSAAKLAPVGENSSSGTAAARPAPSITVLPSPPDSFPPTVVEQPPVDMERLNEFAGGNLENFNELVGLYIKQTTDQLEQIRTALKEGDAERLSRVAHSCAGASATCGMSALMPLLRQVERHGQEGRLTKAAEFLPAIEREFERLQRYLETNKPIALAG